jgi:hypothetical protein
LWTFVRLPVVESLVEHIMSVVTALRKQHHNFLDYLTEARDTVNWSQQSPYLLPRNSAG